MKHNFCTLFDRNYLFKGLAMYNSLLANCPDFTLWVLCMDDLTHDVLKGLKLEKARLVRLCEFEDEELKKAKPTRTVAEYCWTCTPSLPLYVIGRDPSIEMAVYIDADLYFYSDPAPVFEEMGDRSIMIIEHRFPEHLKHLEENGIYNVSLVAFRNDQRGLECARWWRDRCNEWCFYRLEDGKLGDQKYLDDWTERFSGVHVLQHKGAGVALWNVMRYDVRERNGVTYVDEAPLVFYHFHQFQLLRSKSYDFGVTGNYSLTKEDARLIYEPYVAGIEKAVSQVRRVAPDFSHGYKLMRKDSILDKTIRVPKKIKNTLKDLLRR